MQVSLLGSYFDDYSDTQVLQSLWRHFELTHVTPLPDSAFLTMLMHYRQYMRDGMSDAWVTNEMKRNRARIAYPSGSPTDSQIAAFVTTMKQLKTNQDIQNPNEKPSWSEVISDNVITNSLKSDTAKTLLYTVGGLLMLYGIATTATRTLLRR